VSRNHGVTEEKIENLANHLESDVFSPLEKAVIQYSVEMTLTPVDVPEPLWKELKEHFDEPQLVELTAAIAWENWLARFNHALEIPAHGFSDGAFCPVPQRP
jgi:alkylhydroperoxidase family enzyme